MHLFPCHIKVERLFHKMPSIITVIYNFIGYKLILFPTVTLTPLLPIGSNALEFSTGLLKTLPQLGLKASS